MKAHVALKLQQIQGTPDTVDSIWSAPLQKTLTDIREAVSIFQFTGRNLYDRLGHRVHSLIDRRLHQFMETTDFLSSTIQFYSADLHNLKRQSRILFGFSIRTLIPFQIKNNVIHGNLLLRFWYKYTQRMFFRQLA